jgi:hypothetical protein
VTCKVSTDPDLYLHGVKAFTVPVDEVAVVAARALNTTQKRLLVLRCFSCWCCGALAALVAGTSVQY